MPAEANLFVGPSRNRPVWCSTKIEQTPISELKPYENNVTERGRGLLADIHAAWRDIDDLIAERIGAGEAARLAELTRALRDALGGRAPGAECHDTSKLEHSHD